jgi:hypothetical protein
LAKSTGYEAPHYEVFFNLSLHSCPPLGFRTKSFELTDFDTISLVSWLGVSQGISVNKVVDYGLDKQGSIPGRGTDVSLLDSRDKALPHFHPVLMLRIGGVLPPLHLYALMMCCLGTGTSAFTCGSLANATSGNHKRLSDASPVTGP